MGGGLLMRIPEVAGRWLTQMLGLWGLLAKGQIVVACLLTFNSMLCGPALAESWQLRLEMAKPEMENYRALKRHYPEIWTEVEPLLELALEENDEGSRYAAIDDISSAFVSKYLPYILANSSDEAVVKWHEKQLQFLTEVGKRNPDACLDVMERGYISARSLNDQSRPARAGVARRTASLVESRTIFHSGAATATEAEDALVETFRVMIEIHPEYVLALVPENDSPVSKSLVCDSMISMVETMMDQFPSVQFARLARSPIMSDFDSEPSPRLVAKLATIMMPMVVEDTGSDLPEYLGDGVWLVSIDYNEGDIRSTLLVEQSVAGLTAALYKPLLVEQYCDDADFRSHLLAGGRFTGILTDKDSNEVSAFVTLKDCG
jgi:hypothetical protein